MDTLDVEAVESVDGNGVDAPEYVLYGGKGGVGKTTMAAATALASAEGGTRTLVVSTDPAHSLSDTFETDVPPEPTRIRGDMPLFGAEIDPEAGLEEATMFDSEGENPLGGLGELFGDENPMDAMFGGQMPGADEAAAMQKLLQLLDDDRFDRVVVDTAPTGHTLRLLELPEVMDTMVGRMLSFRQRIQGMMGSMKGLFGGGDELDEERGTEDLEAMREQIERLRETLRDPTQTDFRVVMVPEEMSVFESERLLEQLESFDISARTVIVNKVMENLADVTEDVPSTEFVSPNLESCEFCQRRWDVQQSALAEAQDVFRGHDIKRVPLLADEVRGERTLRVVAACLD